MLCNQEGGTESEEGEGNAVPRGGDMVDRRAAVGYGGPEAPTRPRVPHHLRRAVYTLLPSSLVPPFATVKNLSKD